MVMLCVGSDLVVVSCIKSGVCVISPNNQSLLPPTRRPSILCDSTRQRHGTHLHRRQKPLRQGRADDHVQLTCTQAPHEAPKEVCQKSTDSDTHNGRPTSIPIPIHPGVCLTRVHEHAVLRVVHERGQLGLQADHKVTQQMHLARRARGRVVFSVGSFLYLKNNFISCFLHYY